MKKICQMLVLPSFTLCILVVLGVAGKIENGASLSLGWIAFAAIAATWAIIRTAAKG